MQNVQLLFKIFKGCALSIPENWAVGGGPYEATLRRRAASIAWVSSTSPSFLSLIAYIFSAPNLGQAFWPFISKQNAFKNCFSTHLMNEVFAILIYFGTGVYPWPTPKSENRHCQYCHSMDMKAFAFWGLLALYLRLTAMSIHTIPTYIFSGKGSYC